VNGDSGAATSHFDAVEDIVNCRQEVGNTAAFDAAREAKNIGVSVQLKNTTAACIPVIPHAYPYSYSYSNLLFNSNSIVHNFRHMPNHQSNNNNNSKNTLTHDNINNTHTYNKHTLLTLRKAHTNQTQTQIIQTTTLSNNQINNYNIEHKHNKNNTLNNTCKHTKPHFRSKFKQITQIHHINHNTHTKALRSDPPVALAAANCHRGGSWGSPLQQHTGSPRLRNSLQHSYEANTREILPEIQINTATRPKHNQHNQAKHSNNNYYNNNNNFSKPTKQQTKSL
jgi:hypothetical protein